MQRSLWNYLFKEKDPALMAWRWRKPVGIAMMGVGVSMILMGILRVVTG